MIIQNIINTEIEYSKCFSKYYERKDDIRFVDEKMNDMYSHNFILLKNKLLGDDFYNFIVREIEVHKNEYKEYLQIDSHYPFDLSLMDKFKYNFEVTSFDYYCIPVAKYDELDNYSEYQLHKLYGQASEEECLNLDLELNHTILGEEFTRRRFERRKEVYGKENGVEHFVCKKEEKYIGQADYFTKDAYTKIEDFAVLDAYQRKGVGTYILRKLLQKAFLSKEEYGYVLTFKDDPVCVMYKKCGFKYVGSRYSLFVDLNK